MNSISAEEFQPLIEELTRRPLDTNKFRLKAGEGKSQAFGLVNRRCLPPDYSRQCWMRPYLYKLLLDFAKKNVSIPFNAITVNQNYRAAAHRDKGNKGDSLLVAFGDYTGGKLKIHEGELEGSHDIKHTPLITDFSKVLHEVEPWEGNRFSLVFYTLDVRNFEGYVEPPPPSVVQIGQKYFFKRGEEVIKSGLPHPLKGRKVAGTIWIERPPGGVVVSFT